MSVLHNKICNQELRARMLAETEPRITVSFYKYFTINDPHNFRDDLYQKFIKLQVFGRIYIAAEGINAQISVPQNYFSTLRNIIYTAHQQLDKLRLNVALEDNSKSFWVLRMKIRSRIINDGIEDSSFNPTQVGIYLKAEEVNTMTHNPDALFVDIRNHYEYDIGHFEHAIRMPANTFREQLSLIVDILRQEKNRKIILYCTGGIRCEKASAWLLHKGFKKVYQVEGGIIEYARRAREKGLPLKFIGKNFVFDERLGERITTDIIANCQQCHTSCDNYTNCGNHNCHVLFIQCPVCASKFDGCCSLTCKKELVIANTVSSTKTTSDRKQIMSKSNCYL
ncbi:UPF0176 protein [Candidatus Moranella endobia PCVAL]|uniref:oxygen-dependent tRNA uridine(34) hydroxylase TrhO n=1 Tax=Candidatus Moranella endobia TaxID=1048758 RepID=UPI0002C69FC4|nr:rhodanese-related sulfurtransferase [Candidatus Moranella endobia]AGJ61344.1 UPF0176 protein [Candidatus Moranella endobia PCVAL]